MRQEHQHPLKQEHLQRERHLLPIPLVLDLPKPNRQFGQEMSDRYRQFARQFRGYWTDGFVAPRLAFRALTWLRSSPSEAFVTALINPLSRLYSFVHVSTSLTRSSGT